MNPAPPEPVWLCWRENGGRPKVAHRTLEAARTEATRLAGLMYEPVHILSVCEVVAAPPRPPEPPPEPKPTVAPSGRPILRLKPKT